MLNAVWVAVIVAVGCWAVLVCAAVFLLVRLSRLVTQTSQTVAELRERSDLLIERGHASIDRAGEQLARTDAITASMDQVTANMAELTGRVAALAPLARLIAASAGSPLARVPALLYGVNRALSLRRAGHGATPGTDGTMGGRARRPVAGRAGPAAAGAARTALPGPRGGGPGGSPERGNP